MDKQDKMKALDLMIVLGGKKDGKGEEYGNKGKMRCPKCGEVCEPMDDDMEDDMEDEDMD